MKLLYISMFFVTAALFCSCEPLDDTNWVGNSLPVLDWKNVSEQNVRPEDSSKMTLLYVPREEDKSHVLTFDLPENSRGFDVSTGHYDIMAISGNYDLQHTKDLNETLLALPYELNEKQEKVMKQNPDMVYVGTREGIYCDFLKRREIHLKMNKAMRRLNFVVNIADKKELNENCKVQLSGMSAKLNLLTRRPSGKEEYIQYFKLDKTGRHMNEEGCLTTYKGYIHLLGTQGKNIINFTFRDSELVKREIKADITPYLDSWSSNEVTIRLAINIGEDTKLSIDGLEQGNTTDIEF